jgi:hypothetical protein
MKLVVGEASFCSILAFVVMILASSLPYSQQYSGLNVESPKKRLAVNQVSRQ